MKLTRSLALASLCLALALTSAHAETQSVIDPHEGTEPHAPPSGAAKARSERARPDPALRRERQRAAEEQRRRAQAEARAAAAEREAERLRAAEQARQQAEAAQREAAKAAARRAAAAKEAERKAAVREAAAQATAARIAQEERAAATREAAARELAAREAAAREAAQREAVARETAAREAREAAARAANDEEIRRLAQWKRVAPRTAPPEPRANTAKLVRPVGEVFRDCPECPEMVRLPPGDFIMGEGAVMDGARPQVSISYTLAVGRFEVTFKEWDACVAGGGCQRSPNDAGWGRGSQPVINVSWNDARQYVEWLSRRTGHRYRLLTEAEWEYAAKSGTDARYWWGNQSGNGESNCFDCGSKWDGRQAAPVGRFAPNPFGLYDMHGNVSEWVEDCFRDRFKDVAADGKAWTSDCSVTAQARTLRGGAWRSTSRSTRSTARSSAALHYYDNQIGFRVARTD